MPLYKLTEKRMKKRKRDDESGMSEVMALLKEEMSGGSGSSSGSGSGSEEDSESESEGEELSDEETSSSEDADEEDEDEDEDEDGASGGSDAEHDVEGAEELGEGSSSYGEDSEDDDEAIPMSLEAALINPIYPNPRRSDERLCVLCPGKILKHDKMVETHLASGSHKRSSKRYAVRLAEAAERGLDTDDPRVVVRELQEAVEQQKGEDKLPVTSGSTDARKERRALKAERRAAKKAERAAKKARLAPPQQATKEAKKLKERKKADAGSKREGKSFRSPASVRREKRALKALAEQLGNGSSSGGGYGVAGAAYEGRGIPGTKHGSKMGKKAGKTGGAAKGHVWAGEKVLSGGQMNRRMRREAAKLQKGSA